MSVEYLETPVWKYRVIAYLEDAIKTMRLYDDNNLLYLIDLVQSVKQIVMTAPAVKPPDDIRFEVEDENTSKMKRQK